MGNANPDHEPKRATEGRKELILLVTPIVISHLPLFPTVEKETERKKVPRPTPHLQSIMKEDLPTGTSVWRRSFASSAVILYL